MDGGGSSTFVQVKVLFFAKAKELVNLSEALVALPTSTSTNNILDALEKTFPEIKILQRSFVFALNEEYVVIDDQTLTLKEGDILAVIPPLSGG